MTEPTMLWATDWWDPRFVAPQMQKHETYHSAHSYASARTKRERPVTIYQLIPIVRVEHDIKEIQLDE